LIRQFIIPYFNFVSLPSALAYEMVNPALRLVSVVEVAGALGAIRRPCINMYAKCASFS